MMGKMSVDDDHTQFWEDRLADEWDEGGVGYHALGKPFNNWMYRVRKHVFFREAQHVPLTPATAILDVGSGTGLYLDWWRQVGARDVVASDMAAPAVDQLRAHYPNHRVEQLDISAGLGPFEPESFDVISMMDVLFHITDDGKYTAALANISRLLRPGGHFVFSENFLHRPSDRTDHQVNRSKVWTTAALERAGLVIERRKPMLVLMNAQVDAPKAWRKVWGGALRAVTLTPPTGWLAGAMLYPGERLLTTQLSESPTTELAIARKA